LLEALQGSPCRSFALWTWFPLKRPRKAWPGGTPAPLGPAAARAPHLYPSTLYECL
jgi:hypothetical protein